MSLRKLMTGALAAGVAACGLSAVAFAGEFDGVTVNILTRPGYVIAGRLAERGKEFEAATGGKIVVTEVPFAEIFPKIQNDWSTGTNSIDVGVFAAGWGVELDAAGLLEDMDPTSPRTRSSILPTWRPISANLARRLAARPSS